MVGVARSDSKGILMAGVGPISLVVGPTMSAKTAFVALTASSPYEQTRDSIKPTELDVEIVGIASA